MVQTNADKKKRTTKWDDFYSVQEKDERNDEHHDGRKRGDKKHMDRSRTIKQKKGR